MRLSKVAEVDVLLLSIEKVNGTIERIRAKKVRLLDQTRYRIRGMKHPTQGTFLIVGEGDESGSEGRKFSWKMGT